MPKIQKLVQKRTPKNFKNKKIKKNIKLKKIEKI